MCGHSNVLSAAYTSFCDNHNHRFLSQTKPKAVDQTLEQCFLKEIEATCKNFGESDLKQQKAIWNANYKI